MSHHCLIVRSRPQADIQCIKCNAVNLPAASTEVWFMLLLTQVPSTSIEQLAGTEKSVNHCHRLRVQVAIHRFNLGLRELRKAVLGPSAHHR